MIEADQDEMVFVFDQNILFQAFPGDDKNQINPVPGFGGRCFMCDRYDACLCHAANNEWTGFHCESCFYNSRGFISFYLNEFFDLEQENEYQDIDLNKLRRAGAVSL